MKRREFLRGLGTGAVGATVGGILYKEGSAKEKEKKLLAADRVELIQITEEIIKESIPETERWNGNNFDIAEALRFLAMNMGETCLSFGGRAQHEGWADQIYDPNGSWGVWDLTQGLTGLDMIEHLDDSEGFPSRINHEETKKRWKALMEWMQKNIPRGFTLQMLNVGGFHDDCGWSVYAMFMDSSKMLDEWTRLVDWADGTTGIDARKLKQMFQEGTFKSPEDSHKRFDQIYTGFTGMAQFDENDYVLIRLTVM